MITGDDASNRTSQRGTELRRGENAAEPPESGVSSEERTLFAALDRLGIAHRTVAHPATHTVRESAAVKADLPGGHAKSLLVKSKHGLYLLVALGTVRVDLRGVGRALGAGRLSFAAPETLFAALGLRPGAVTPFGLMARGSAQIDGVVVDEALLTFDPIWLHPLRNTASTAISPADLLRFCEAYGRRTVRMNLARPSS